MSDSGFAGGYSFRFDGFSELGAVAWVVPVEGGSPKQIGLTGMGQTRADGYQDNRLEYLAGTHAAGSAALFEGNDFKGRAAWVADVHTGATTQIGLRDAQHTSSTGQQDSRVRSLSNSYSAGESTRYVGPNQAGQSAWVFSLGASSIASVGLFDARHTSAFGERSSSIYELTESGYAIGHSLRYNDAGAAGQTAWIYYAPSETLWAFDLPSQRSDHFAFSSIKDVSESGSVVGEYDLFGDSGGYIGRRAFGWTTTRGFFDLGDAIGGGLPADWDYLSAGLFTNEAGDAVGAGVVSFGGAVAAFAARSVPEPAVALYCASAAVCFLGRRRRRLKRAIKK